MSNLSVSEARLAATDWALRGSVALAFILFGMEKLAGSGWVKLFAEIGLGQWFRYFTGILQVLGGALLVIPKTARAGAALLAATMLGATVVHLFVLRTGPAALFPAILLAAIVAVGWKRRSGSEQPESLKLG